MPEQELQVPICVCRHPLDAHDPKSGERIFPPRCSCSFFEDSGRRETVKKGTP